MHLGIRSSHKECLVIETLRRDVSGRPPRLPKELAVVGLKHQFLEIMLLNDIRAQTNMKGSRFDTIRAPRFGRQDSRALLTESWLR